MSERAEMHFCATCGDLCCSSRALSPSRGEGWVVEDVRLLTEVEEILAQGDFENAAADVRNLRDRLLASPLRATPSRSAPTPRGATTEVVIRGVRYFRRFDKANGGEMWVGQNVKNKGRIECGSLASLIAHHYETNEDVLTPGEIAQLAALAAAPGGE